MFKSKKKTFSLITLIAIAFFSFGFVTAQSMEKVNWVGYLVHGIYNQVDASIIPDPSGYVPEVKGDIVLGLREDGVVVWKHIADTTNQ